MSNAGGVSIRCVEVLQYVLHTHSALWRLIGMVLFFLEIDTTPLGRERGPVQAGPGVLSYAEALTCRLGSCRWSYEYPSRLIVSIRKVILRESIESAVWHGGLP